MSGKSRGDRQIERNKRKQSARSDHRRLYWIDRSKEDYLCPDCRRGVESVDGFEVHHKDRDPTNGHPENLVALCKRCHYARHGAEYDPRSLEKWKARVEEM